MYILEAGDEEERFAQLRHKAYLSFTMPKKKTGFTNKFGLRDIF